jgi:uncharacterized membrane protein
LKLDNFLILVVALAVVGVSVYVTDRFWDHEKRREHTDVAGFIYAGVAVLYAVLLAFVVILGWETLSSAQATTYDEADQLANIYWIAHGVPAPAGPAVDKLCLDYAHTVINVEWPMMDEGKSSPRVQDLMNQIRDDVFRFNPTDDRQEVLYEQAVESVNNLSGDRRDRLDAMSETVPEPIWVALIAGGIIMTGFCLLFGLKNRKVHILMVMGVAALVVISLLLIKNMQYPFSGDPHIGPTSFQVFLSTLSPAR